MAYFKRYRLLVVVYLVAILVGAREFLVTQDRGTVEWPGSDWSEVTDVIAQINPDDPDTEFLRGLRSLADGDEVEFNRHLEEALASDIKHNDVLLQYYAQLVLNSPERTWQEVNQAVNRWRENHPSSPETLWMRVATGPSSQADVRALDRAFARVPWVADIHPERFEEDGEEQWRVLLMFRPAQTVDMREAVAALTTLSIPDEQRPYFDVTCTTMVDCTMTRRPGR